MIPIVAYSGGDDPQKTAADNIENRLKELKIDTMTHLVAPGLGHKFPDAEWFKKANALWSEYATRDQSYPQEDLVCDIHDKISDCDWIEIHGAGKALRKGLRNAEAVRNRTETVFKIDDHRMSALEIASCRLAHASDGRRLCRRYQYQRAMNYKTGLRVSLPTPGARPRCVFMTRGKWKMT